MLVYLKFPIFQLFSAVNFCICFFQMKRPELFHLTKSAAKNSVTKNTFMEVLVKKANETDAKSLITVTI